MRRRVLLLAGLLAALLLLVTYTVQPAWLGFDGSKDASREAPPLLGSDRPGEGPGLAGRGATSEQEAPDGAQDTASAEQPGRLVGRVVDQGGRPIEGAAVSVWGGAPPPDLVEAASLHDRIHWTPPEPFAIPETDADGRFVIEDTGGGDVLLVASASGYTTASMRVIVADGRVAGGRPPTLRLTKVAPLHGRVVRADGSGVPDAKVALLHDLNTTQQSYDEARCETDADGRFRFDVRPRGADLAVVAHVSGHPTTGRRIRPDEQDIRLVLSGDADVTLRVLDAVDARGIEHMRINVLLLPKERSDTWLPSEWSGLTDARGEVRFTAESNAELIVGFVHPSGATGWHAPLGGTVRGPEDVLLAKGQNVVVYTFSRLVSLAGRVTDTDGMPIAGARVLDQGMPFARADLGAVTDEEGRYRIDRIAAAAVELVVRAEGYAGVQETARVAPDFEGTFEKNFRLERAYTVRGRVVDGNGAPLAGVRVRVTEDGKQPCVLGNFFDGSGREAITDRDGTYVLDGAAAGRHFAVGRLPGRADAHAGPFEVEGDTAAPDLVLERGVDLVIRVEGPGGALLPGAGVKVGPDPTYHRWWLGIDYAEPPTLTAADGRLTLRDMPRMKVYVLANHSKYAPGYRVIDLAADPPAGGVYAVRLARPVTLRGRVIDDAGNPVVGVVVSVGGETPEGRYAQTDKAGRFAIPRLRAGTGWVTIDERTYKHEIAQVRISRAEVEIRLTRLNEDELAKLKALSAREDELYEKLDEHERASEEFKAVLKAFHDVQSQIDRLRGVPEDP